MKGNNQNKFDKRPIRRKDKYNPYTLYSIGAKTDEPHYYVSFTDVNGVEINVEINKELFDAFDRFELEDLSASNEIANHYEQSDLLENTMERRMLVFEKSVEEVVIDNLNNAQLHNAISKLTKTQRRRLLMYYFEGLTLNEIAQREGRDYKSIVDSIHSSLKKIKKFLN